MLYRLACTCMCILVSYRLGGLRNSSQGLVSPCDLATYDISDIFWKLCITFSDCLRTVRCNTSKWLNLRECEFSGAMTPDHCCKEVQPNLIDVVVHENIACFSLSLFLPLSLLTALSIDQNHRKHIVQTFKPTPESSSFQRPQSDMNVASGCPQFTKLSTLDDDNYVKGDVMYIKCIVDTSRIFHP